MGTNFYMMTTNKDLVETYFPYEYKIVDTPYFGYEIHIGKRSCGWKPIFEAHKDAYSSVKEMKEFIKIYRKSIRIFDEYGEEFTLEQLDEELIKWGEKQETRYIKFIPEGIPDEIFGGKKYFVESTKDDYDLTIPYDHIEYEKYDMQRFGFKESCYSKDCDGYNFLNGDFS